MRIGNNGARTHELKTWPRYFQEVWLGTKLFELRRNDRDFKVGDVLLLKEWEEPSVASDLDGYTGRWVRARVLYILEARHWLVGGADWVILSIHVEQRCAQNSEHFLVTIGEEPMSNDNDTGIDWNATAAERAQCTLELEFLELVETTGKEIQDKLVEATKLLREATELSRKSGLPFRSNISEAGQAYVPSTYPEKFAKLDKDKVADLLEIGTYTLENADGWEHSQICW